YYSDIFNSANQSGAASISLGQEALKHVQNKTLSDKLDSLKSLHQTIPQDITNRDFNTTDADIALYKNLTAQVQNGSLIIIGQYNETRNAKNIENSLILVLQTKDLDAVSQKSLDLLVNKTSDVDTRFRDGITLSQLSDLEAN